MPNSASKGREDPKTLNSVFVIRTDKITQSPGVPANADSDKCKWDQFQKDIPLGLLYKCSLPFQHDRKNLRQQITEILSKYGYENTNRRANVDVKEQTVDAGAPVSGPLTNESWWPKDVGVMYEGCRVGKTTSKNELFVQIETGDTGDVKSLEHSKVSIYRYRYSDGNYRLLTYTRNRLLLERELEEVKKAGVNIDDDGTATTPSFLEPHQLEHFRTNFLSYLESCGYVSRTGYRDIDLDPAKLHAEKILNATKAHIKQISDTATGETKYNCFCGRGSFVLAMVKAEGGGNELRRVHLKEPTSRYRTQCISVFFLQRYKTHLDSLGMFGVPTSSNNATAGSSWFQWLSASQTEAEGPAYEVCLGGWDTKETKKNLEMLREVDAKTIPSLSRSSSDQNTPLDETDIKSAQSFIDTWEPTGDNGWLPTRFNSGWFNTLKPLCASLASQYEIDPRTKQGSFKFGGPCRTDNDNKEVLNLLTALRAAHCLEYFPWVSTLGTRLERIKSLLKKCPMGDRFTWNTEISYSRRGIEHSGAPMDNKQDATKLLQFIRDYRIVLSRVSEVDKYRHMLENICDFEGVHPGPSQGTIGFPKYVRDGAIENAANFQKTCGRTILQNGLIPEVCRFPIKGVDDAVFNQAQWAVLGLPNGNWMIVLRPGMGKTAIGVELMIRQWLQDREEGEERGYIMIVPGPNMIPAFMDQFKVAVDAKRRTSKKLPYAVRAWLNPFSAKFREDPKYSSEHIQANGPPVVFMTYGDLRNLCFLRECLYENENEHILRFTNNHFAIQSLFKREGKKLFVDPRKLYVVCDEGHNLVHLTNSQGAEDLEVTSFGSAGFENYTFRMLAEKGNDQFPRCAGKPALKSMAEFLAQSRFVILSATPISIDEISGQSLAAKAKLETTYATLFPNLPPEHYVVSGLGTPKGSLLVNQLAVELTSWTEIMGNSPTKSVEIYKKDVEKALTTTNSTAFHRRLTEVVPQMNSSGSGLLKLTRQDEEFVKWLFDNRVLTYRRLDRVLCQCIPYVNNIWAHISRAHSAGERTVVFFNSSEGNIHSKLIAKCKAQEIRFMVASMASPSLHSFGSISGTKTGEQKQALANIEHYNKKAIIKSGPWIFFYDYFGLKESIDILQVRNSFFLTLPLRDASSNTVSATAFTQTLGRSNRFGSVPADVDDKTHMYAKIFGGMWERTRCCELFQNLLVYQDSFSGMIDVTQKQDGIMDVMYDFSKSGCSLAQSPT